MIGHRWERFVDPLLTSARFSFGERRLTTGIIFFQGDLISIVAKEMWSFIINGERRNLVTSWP